MRFVLMLGRVCLCAAVGLTTGLGAAAAPDLTASLQFVCDPSNARWGTGNAAARSVLDLQVYNDRLFPGMGEWDGNLGPVYAMAINPFTGTCSNEYTMGTESCETIRVLADGNLHFPATDMKDGHASAGYWFRRNAAGEWYTRKSAFVDSKLSIHIWDFTFSRGATSLRATASPRRRTGRPGRTSIRTGRGRASGSWPSSSAATSSSLARNGTSRTTPRPVQ